MAEVIKSGKLRRKSLKLGLCFHASDCFSDRIIQANEAYVHANTLLQFFPFFDALVPFYLKFKAERLRLAVRRWRNGVFSVFILFIYFVLPTFLPRFLVVSHRNKVSVFKHPWKTSRFAPQTNYFVQHKPSDTPSEFNFTKRDANFNGNHKKSKKDQRQTWSERVEMEKLPDGSRPFPYVYGSVPALTGSFRHLKTREVSQKQQATFLHIYTGGE